MSVVQSSFNEKLWHAGLKNEEACAALTNPGFVETFPLSAPTLDHPSYRICGVPLMNGKLDWLLHRGGLYPADRALGNHDYSASDHKWLAADFSLPGIVLQFYPPTDKRRSSDSGNTGQQGAVPGISSLKPPLSTCA